MLYAYVQPSTVCLFGYKVLAEIEVCSVQQCAPFRRGFIVARIILIHSNERKQYTAVPCSLCYRHHCRVYQLTTATPGVFDLNFVPAGRAAYGVVMPCRAAGCVLVRP